LKASAGYIQRGYYNAAFNKSLASSSFSEQYRYKRKHVQFQEELFGEPAWNNSKAWAAGGNATLTFPVSDTLSVEISSTDMLLNGVPSGYRRNSFQLSMGITYSFSVE
jgi:hypothetical protein